MSRVQLALRVGDLEESIEYYSRLFGTQPATRRPGYANFTVSEPAIKLVLREGRPGQETVLDHLGVEVEATQSVYSGNVCSDFGEAAFSPPIPITGDGCCDV
jgi:catechol 2,3-dioxygenase-like lactoylglutathione lyase family enzyme